MRAEAAWSARDTEESTAGRVASEINVKGRGRVCDHSDYTPPHPEAAQKTNRIKPGRQPANARPGFTEKFPKYMEISCLPRPGFHAEKTER